MLKFGERKLYKAEVNLVAKSPGWMGGWGDESVVAVRPGTLCSLSSFVDAYLYMIHQRCR